MTTRKRGRPRNKAIEELEERFDVSARRVRQLIAEFGLDKIEDAAVLKLHEKRALIALRSIRADRERTELAVARRDLIPKDEAVQHGVRLAEHVNQLITEAQTNWPTELAGKTEIQVREALDKILNEFTEKLRAMAPDI
jgi:hypothetical protein